MMDERAKYAAPYGYASCQEYQDYLAVNPPAYIKPYAAPAGEAGNGLIQNYGDCSFAFELKCKCRGLEFEIKGSRQLGRDYFCNPFVLHCLSCQHTLQLINPYFHGWDGMLVWPDSEEEIEPVNEAELSTYNCKQCQHGSFKVTVAFQYCLDEPQVIHDDQLDMKPEDLFGCFAGECVCVNCGAVDEFASVECQ